MLTIPITRVVPCAYLASLDFTAQAAGLGACLVRRLEQARQASSLLRVHHLQINVFVGLASVALAVTRCALLVPSGVYCAAESSISCGQPASYFHDLLNHIMHVVRWPADRPCLLHAQQHISIIIVSR
jgi:hypothetical protein